MPKFILQCATSMCTIKSTWYRKNRYRVKSYQGWAISNRIDIASGMCNNINIESRSLYWVPELSESYRNRLRGSKIIRIVSISYYGFRGLSISYQYRFRSVWEYHIVSTMKKPISHNTVSWRSKYDGDKRLWLEGKIGQKGQNVLGEGGRDIVM